METLLVTDLEASRLLGISRSKFHLLVAEGRILRLMSCPRPSASLGLADETLPHRATTPYPGRVHSVGADAHAPGRDPAG
jgi:hypothetical protein